MEEDKEKGQTRMWWWWCRGKWCLVTYWVGLKWGVGGGRGVRLILRSKSRWDRGGHRLGGEVGGGEG